MLGGSLDYAYKLDYAIEINYVNVHICAHYPNVAGMASSIRCQSLLILRGIVAPLNATQHYGQIVYIPYTTRRYDWLIHVLACSDKSILVFHKIYCACIL